MIAFEELMGEGRIQLDRESLHLQLLALQWMLETDPELRGVAELINFVDARASLQSLREGWVSLPDAVRSYAIMMVPPEGRAAANYLRDYANSSRSEIVGLQGVQPIAMQTLGLVSYLPASEQYALGHYVWHGWDGVHELTMDSNVLPRVHDASCFDQQNAAAIFWDCRETMTPLAAVTRLPPVEEVRLPDAAIDGLTLAEIDRRDDHRLWLLHQQLEFGRHIRLPSGIFDFYHRLTPEAPEEEGIVLFSSAEEQSLWLALMLRAQGVEWAADLPSNDWDTWLGFWADLTECPLAMEAKSFVEAQQAEAAQAEVNET
jgi:hypothetical protein